MKIKNLFTAMVLLSAVSVTSCVGEKKPAKDAFEAEETTKTTESWNGYRSVDIRDADENIIKLLADDWMLITAGNTNSYNTMTASWGGVGHLWQVPVSFIFIRDTRYTYEFLQREEGYTLSFFDDEYRSALVICGSKSGREGDKVAEAGLTAMEMPSGQTSFEQARLIVECKRMFAQRLEEKNLSELYSVEVMKHYQDGSMHTMFIGEITKIWVKE